MKNPFKILFSDTFALVALVILGLMFFNTLFSIGLTLAENYTRPLGIFGEMTPSRLFLFYTFWLIGGWGIGIRLAKHKLEK